MVSIVSGSDIPGEEESKIMAFFRGLKALDSVEPLYKTLILDSEQIARHCFVSNDSDLILLGFSRNIRIPKILMFQYLDLTQCCTSTNYAHASLKSLR